MLGRLQQHQALQPVGTPLSLAVVRTTIVASLQGGMIGSFYTVHQT